MYKLLIILSLSLIACNKKNKEIMNPNELKNKKLETLEFNISIQDSMLNSRDTFLLNMELNNNSLENVVINKRLSIGYQTSISREVYFKILNFETQENVANQMIDYNRSDANVNDFGILKPSKSITKTINIKDWYEINLPKGKHKLMIIGFYQANEDNNENQIKNVIKGIFQSEPLTFYWEQK